jgi:non-ribosomal peptide synthetase component F
VEINVPKETVDALQALAASEQASLFAVMETSFAIILHLATGEPDIVVGTNPAARPHPSLQDAAGLFGVSLPLRHQLSKEHTFSVALAEDGMPSWPPSSIRLCRSK